MFANVSGSLSTVDQTVGDELLRQTVSNTIDILTDIILSHKGHRVKINGDEILSYFTDVDTALLAASRMQEIMEGVEILDTMGVTMRIGMQWGGVILEANDIFGDSVNVAARIASMAKSRQILCTKEIALMVNSPELSSRLRPFDHIKVKGKREPVDIYSLLSGKGGTSPNKDLANNLTSLEQQQQSKSFIFSYRGKNYKIPVSTRPYILGRGRDSDLLVDGDLVSVQHSKLEWRSGKLIISDQSTNGTFIKTQDADVVFLQREEFTLQGFGSISLGKNVDQNDESIIHFFSE